MNKRLETRWVSHLQERVNGGEINVEWSAHEGKD